MKLSGKKLITFLVGLSISLFAIYFIFKKIDVSTSIDALNIVSLSTAFSLMGIYLLGFLFRTFRWKLMLSQYSLTFGTLLKSIVVGYAGNNFLPARGGELLRMEFFSRTGKVNRSVSLSSVLTEKILDGLSLLFVLIGVVWVSDADLLQIDWFHSLFILANALFLGAVSFLIVLKVLGNRLLTPLKEKGGIFQKIGLVLTGVLDSLQFLRFNIRSGIIIALGIGVWLVEGSMFGLAFSELGLPVSPILTGYLTLVVVNFGILVPSSPGYVGVFQAMTILALSLFQVSEEKALSASLLIHACQFFPITLWGLLILAESSLKNFRGKGN